MLLITQTSQIPIKKLFYMLVIPYFFQTTMFGKKNNDTFFDVPIGSFHGADICDLVGLYILSKLGKVFSNCSLNRDDG